LLTKRLCFFPAFNCGIGIAQIKHNIAVMLGLYGAVCFIVQYGFFDPNFGIGILFLLEQYPGISIFERRGVGLQLIQLLSS